MRTPRRRSGRAAAAECLPTCHRHRERVVVVKATRGNDQPAAGPKRVVHSTQAGCEDLFGEESRRHPDQIKLRSVGELLYGDESHFETIFQPARARSFAERAPALAATRRYRRLARWASLRRTLPTSRRRRRRRPRSLLPRRSVRSVLRATGWRTRRASGRRAPTPGLAPGACRRPELPTPACRARPQSPSTLRPDAASRSSPAGASSVPSDSSSARPLAGSGTSCATTRPIAASMYAASRPLGC